MVLRAGGIILWGNLAVNYTTPEILTTGTTNLYRQTASLASWTEIDTRFPNMITTKAAGKSLQSTKEHMNLWTQTWSLISCSQRTKQEVCRNLIFQFMTRDATALRLMLQIIHQ